VSLRHLRLRQPFVLACLAWALGASSLGQTAVGPRVLEKQTESAVKRDYLQAWKAMENALEENRLDLLEASFVGPAKQKLAEAIREQRELGVKTVYRDTAHELKLVFYSPEGLSIQVVDNVEYDVQVVDHDKVVQTQHVRSRYVAILTPTEVRWTVRVFEAEPE
jgi:hypothetical protein